MGGLHRLEGTLNSPADISSRAPAAMAAGFAASRKDRPAAGLLSPPRSQREGPRVPPIRDGGSHGRSAGRLQHLTAAVCGDQRRTRERRAPCRNHHSITQAWLLPRLLPQAALTWTGTESHSLRDEFGPVPGGRRYGPQPQGRIPRPPRGPFPSPLVARGRRVGLTCGPVRGEPQLFAGPDFGTQRSCESTTRSRGWERASGARPLRGRCRRRRRGRSPD